MFRPFFVEQKSPALLRGAANGMKPFLLSLVLEIVTL